MKKFLCTFLTLLLATGTLTSCNRENNLIQPIEKEDRPVRFLIPTSYDFMLDLPINWTNTCTIEPSDFSDSIAFFTKSIKDVDDEYQGWLGTFMKVSDESLSYNEFISRSEELTGGLGFRYMYSDENGTYGMHYPSELQWNPDIAGQVDEWCDMFSLMNEIAIVDANGEVISAEPSASDREFINQSISDIKKFSDIKETEPAALTGDNFSTNK